MEILPFEKLSESSLPIESIALGFFDAVHVGHQKLLKRTLKLAPKKAAVLTFNKNPSAFLNHQNQKPLLTFQQKKSILKKMGFIAIITIDFSFYFSRMKGEEFIKRLLQVSSLRWLVAGADFQCGHQKATDIEKIKAILIGSSVQLSVVELNRKRATKVSSTMIRSLINQGDFKAVRRLTGRFFELLLPFSVSQFQENSINRWQFSIQDFPQLLPKEGIFLVKSRNHFGKMIILQTVVELIFPAKTIENRVIIIQKMRRK